MLFSDLSNPQARAAMEAENYADLERASSRLSRRYSEARRTIVQIHGDGVLAVFGYPMRARTMTPGDGSGARSSRHGSNLRFELALPDPAPESAQRHSLGLVLFDEGDLVRGRFELGNATNIARTR